RMLRVRGLIHPTSAVCATTDTARGEERLPSEQNQAILKSSGRPLGECRFAHDRWIGDLSVAIGARRVIEKPLQLYRRHGANESQWVFSDPRGVTLVSVIAQTGFASPVDSWKTTLGKNEIIRNRLREANSILASLGLSDRAAVAEAYIQGEQDRFSTRIHLLSLPRWRRWVSVIGFWARGGYRRFAGWKSAVKDMIRP
ncbi:hypothetical protein, partial [Paragemmobacter kunshanensis]|uniref:hypothetical protein n=1 Tax=Paragemmobacter kunshanensis TaxID=2583234 RepID=UPI0019D302F0